MGDFIQSVGTVITDFNIRCHRCNRYLIAFASRPWRIKCHRCKAVNQAGDPPEEIPEK